jgi:hypothetical protein
VEVWFADNRIWIKLENGNVASDLISRYPILAKATPEQLQKFEIIDGYALHWPELDEDLSVAGFFEANTEQRKNYVEETSSL